MLCRSNKELCQDSTGSNSTQFWGDPLPLLQRTSQDRRKKYNICKEYTIEATIQNKMRLGKFDAYTAKETLEYGRRKIYVAATKGQAKRE